MQITTHLEALRSDIASLAALGDEALARASERVATALESSLRLRLLDVVAAAAEELSQQLPDGRAELRLVSGEPVLAYVPDERAPAAPVGDDLQARISLRLPEALKAQVDKAAAQEGVSVNTWLVQAIARGLERRPHRVGKQLRGFAQS
jgi:hypothetical protein